MDRTVHPWAPQVATGSPAHPQLLPRDSVSLEGFFASHPDCRDVALAQALATALLVAEPADGVIPFDPATMVYPQAVAALADGTLLVASRDSGHIHHCAIDGSPIRVMAGPMVLSTPMSLHVRRDGSVVVADLFNAEVVILAAETGDVVQRVKDPLMMMLKGCVELANGEMVISSYGTGKLLLLRRDDSVDTIPVPGVGRPGALAISADRTKVYVADEQQREVWEVDFSGNELRGCRVVCRGASSEGLAVLPDGSLVVCNSGHCVIDRFRQTSTADDGMFEAIGTYGFGRGRDPAQFDYPTGVCALPGGRIAVCDRRVNRVQILSLAPRSSSN